jgi:hypothetical protein
MLFKLWHDASVLREPCLPATPTLKRPKSLRTFGSYFLINNVHS